jgi:hypothetical protein
MSKLIPAAVAATIPALYAQEEIEDPIVHVKLFALASGATWYLTEFSALAPDGTPNLGFGLCCLSLGGDELGYVSLDELEALRWCGIPRVERDVFFTPTPLSTIRAKLAC